MIQNLSRILSKWAHKYVPDPLSIAIILTLFTMFLCTIFTQYSWFDIIGFWGGRIHNQHVIAQEKGLWKLLSFTMQMCLILVSGHALAMAPSIQKLLYKLSQVPQTATQAIVITSITAMIAGLLNWGLGLIVGALLAREMGRNCQHRGLNVHYPLLGAAGYAGLLVWHGGLSGSAPLKVTQSKDIIEILGQSDLQAIALSETLWSPLNYTVNLVLLITVPLLLMAMHPKSSEARVIDEYIDQNIDLELDRRSDSSTSHIYDQNSNHLSSIVFAQRLNESPWLSRGIAILGFMYLYQYLSLTGLNYLDLNTINLCFISMGFLLHQNAMSYAKAVQQAVLGCSGILIQFPLYAGIMAMMSLSGLSEQIAEGITTYASADNFSSWTFLSAGIVNLFIPSGGGQWAVQGPLLIQSAQSLHAPLGEVVMAFAYGDAWTNMLQPFWALPLLGITGLKARHIVGYTATLMFLVLPIYLILFWMF
jgi:short-chain fatty acids transporter